MGEPSTSGCTRDNIDIEDDQPTKKPTKTLKPVPPHTPVEMHEKSRDDQESKNKVTIIIIVGGSVPIFGHIQVHIPCTCGGWDAAHAPIYGLN